MNLFGDAWSGRYLDVSHETHEFLAEHFPEVDLASAYREADAWLFHMPAKRRPRNLKRFLVNWLKKEKKFVARNPNLQAELHIGTGPRG